MPTNDKMLSEHLQKAQDAASFALDDLKRAHARACASGKACAAMLAEQLIAKSADLRGAIAQLKGAIESDASASAS